MVHVTTTEGYGDDNAVVLDSLGLQADQVFADVLTSAVEHLEAYTAFLDAFSSGGEDEVVTVRHGVWSTRLQLTTSTFTHMQATVQLSLRVPPTE